MVAAYIVAAVIFGLITGLIAQLRGVRPVFGFIVLGAVLPLVGIIVAAIAKPSPPAGMMAVTCPQCNGRQNIPEGAREWTCWQCHAEWQLPAAYPR